MTRSLPRLAIAVSLASAIGSSACASQSPPPAKAPVATAPVAPRAPKPSPEHDEVAALLERARTIFREGDKDAAFALIAQARARAAGDVLLGDDVALTEAAMHAYREDFDGAARLVVDRIRTPRPQDAAVFNLHDVMIFVCEARDDKAAAVLEALEMRSVAERWPPPLHPRVRLGYTWQRAHTLRAFAETLSGLARETAILYASRARQEFSALARASQMSLPSIAVLEEQFATLDGDGPKALAIARGLDLTKLDPQDLYITSLALDAGGDHAAAADARARIENNREIGLFEATYAYLARKAASARPAPR